jgi:hypothetical protein
MNLQIGPGARQLCWLDLPLYGSSSVYFRLLVAARIPAVAELADRCELAHTYEVGERQTWAACS